MCTAKLLSTTLLFVLSLSVAAQVRTKFNNKELIGSKGRFIKSYKTQVDFELPAKDINKLLEKEKKEDEQFKGEKPFRFAEPVSVDLDITNSINWIVDTGYVYGSFTIKANGALSTSINFDQFYLPKGTEMYIYNKDGNIITGPISENENNPNRQWGSWVYKGSLLIVEIKTPLSTKDSLLLHLSNIAYGYKQVYIDQIGGFGQSASCEINVVCPIGTGWEAERNSVASVLNDNGTIFSSGAMIMNTCGTNRPFFLTANHFYAANQNVAGWRFMFQAWSSTCPNPGTNSDGVTYNGSTLRANWDGSDFCLVELNNTPPANSGIHYAGWNRGTTGITQTTILHHPRNDVMKITRDINPPVFGTYGTPHYWELVVDNGTTEGGSSGAPYFDQNHRIIGQHRGIGDPGLPICQQVSKFGGRFNISWTGGGTNATRLSDWLDPDNSGAMTTNTTNVSALFPHIANPTITVTGSPTNDYICTGSSTYTLNGLPANATVSWSISNSNYATIPNPSTGTSVVVTKVGVGVVALTANVNICGQQPVTVSKNIMVGAAVDGYYRIASNYHNQGISYPLYNNNSPVWLPASKTFGVDVWLNSPGLQSANWSRASNSYPFSWSTSGTFLSFSGSSGTTAFEQRNAIFNLSAQTVCGTVNGTYTWPIIVQGWGAFSMEVSPNPATDAMTLLISKESPKVKELSKDENVVLQLVELSTGRIEKQWRFKNNQRQFKLDIRGVRKGIYLLKANIGNYQESKQVIIE